MTDHSDINLTNADLSQLIGDIYDAALTSEWVGVLDKIIEATQSNKAFFFLQKLDEPRPLLSEFKINFDYSMDAFNDYQNRVFEDPRYQVTKNAIEGESLNLNDHIDITQHKGSYFYDNIIEPMRSHQSLAGQLIRDGNYESVYVVNRGLDDPKYSPQDFNLIKLLTPHMLRAVHTFKSLQLYKHYASISKSILDQTDKGIVVCDKAGRIILSNQFTNEHLASCGQFSLENNRLALVDKAQNRELNHYFSQCADLSFKGIGTQESIVIDGADDEMIIVSLSPFRDRGGRNEFDTPCCLVTITFQRSLNWELFSNKFGLTKRESQLVKAIYSKKRLNDLVSVFNVSYNTLRTHLQSIFRKTDVNSQTELMIKMNMFKG